MADDGFTRTVPPVYNAGGLGRRLRTYRPTSAGPNSVVAFSNGLIRNRSRAAARNDPWAGASLEKLVSNEIGTGIQAKTKNGTTEYRGVVKKKWDRWTKECDADGVLDFYGQQALIDREWHEAGECFVRLRQRLPKDGLSVPLQLQLIESEQCPVDYNGQFNGNIIQQGIEFNAIRQRVAYWMYAEHPGDQQFQPDGHTLRRIPAEQILHIYEPLRAGQLRGIPRMTSTLVRMLNLDNLDDAVLERQKIANLFSMFYVPPEGTDDGAGGTMIGDMQTGTDHDGTPLAGMEPGTGQEVPPGWDVKFSTPPDAGPNYAPYLKTQLQAISARNGIPYEVLTGDLTGVSDRALKLILNEFRRIIEQRQWLYLIPMLCQPVREAWWDAAVLAGSLDAPNYATDRDDFVETTWVPQGWPYSHPVQDVTADEAAVRNGFKSRQSVILGNGDDPEQTTTEIIEDNTVADKNDLIFDSDARYTSVKGITQAKPAGSAEPNTDDQLPADGAEPPAPAPKPKAK